MRTVKDPKERRKEIIDMASGLFLSRGYEETSVNMIVDQLGVAKGTFYHYFKSKEDILEAVLEDYLSQYAESIKALLEDSSGNAFERFMLVMSKILSNDKGPEHLTKHIEDNRNARLHQAMDEKFHEKFYPIITNVLKQGMEEGIFHINYPEEITEILLFGVRAYMHVHIPCFGDPQYLIRKLRALEELFNKVLGIKDERYEIKLI